MHLDLQITRPEKMIGSEQLPYPKLLWYFQSKSVRILVWCRNFGKAFLPFENQIGGKIWQALVEAKFITSLHMRKANSYIESHTTSS